MKLITENIPGNLHQAAAYINRLGSMADYVLAMNCVSGENTVVVFRVPDSFDLTEHLRGYRHGSTRKKT